MIEPTDARYEVEFAVDWKQWMLGFNWFTPFESMVCANVFAGPFRCGITRRA